VIDGDLVFINGMAGDSSCLRLSDGSIIWKKNLDREYGKAPLFSRADPVRWSGRTSSSSMSAARRALPASTNKAANWSGGRIIRGMRVTLRRFPRRFTGRIAFSSSLAACRDPPTGGLLVVDPVKGTIENEVPWRSNNFASVNAASPVVIGNEVFITEGYDHGGALLQFCSGHPETLNPLGGARVWPSILVHRWRIVA